MGFLRLEPPCPKSVNGVSIDPNPNWSFDDLLSELDSLDSKFNNSGSPLQALPFTKSPMREIPGAGRREKNGAKTFVMRVADDDEFDLSDDEDEDEDEDEVESKSLVPASRFFCDDVFLSDSDDSEDEAMQPLQVALIDKTGVVEGAFIEQTHEHQLAVKEEIRSQLAALETRLVTEKEKSTSALVQVNKFTDARRERDRRRDMDYQRMIAEALDDHLTAIQRDHEHRSQIEERKIRDDAAIEEAKRKEKALLEEKLRLQKAKAEEEARCEAARREEERKLAEDERAKQAANKLAEESAKAKALTIQNAPSTTPAPDVAKNAQSAGLLVRAAENALKLEERRLQNYKELEDRNQSIVSSSNMDFSPKEREIARRIRQISGSIDNVRSKVNELLKIFNDPAYPQSVTVAMFAKNVISFFEARDANFSTSAFACGHIIVYVSAQVPAVMECLLAEFHKACMYTVPKHIVYKKTAFQTKDSYFKAIGYREEDGKLESTENFLQRLESYMKLYGAIVQTEAQGTQHMHGLEEGWIWLARFLNCLPANSYTAVALEAFLKMAGFALYKRYKLQFGKILTAISQQFLPTLRARADPQDTPVITRIQGYIESKEFLKEPEGWLLRGTLLSRTFDQGGGEYY